MASIQAIEQTSVHQIQSGQVIVDLNSVVKELVENSLDAGSTSIEVRFRNHGLEAIEVIDNGTGIAPEDFESVALKHHTSKLRSYDDLENLDTFGFRGEALASLCALSQLYVITAREVDRPRGTRLDFEVSGRLKNTSTVATPRGTKVVVEKIFHNLPVRKKELEKNIKREYSKVLTLLQAYACISTGVRFTVSNQMPKGTKTTSFTTPGSAATKDNIIKVFGSKSLRDLVALDLKFEMQATTSGLSTQDDGSCRAVKVEGHISRPVTGEGRSAPDRQMFYVNSRPCGLPQVAKIFNEVYKAFNISQSPFVFANLIMDTNSYDVNVSPDKRTILLHDQGALLESLRESLMELFESHEQTVPQTSVPTQPKLPGYKPLTVARRTEPEPELELELELEPVSAIPEPSTSQEDPAAVDELLGKQARKASPERLIHDWVGRGAQDRDDVPKVQQKPPVQNAFDRMRPQRTPQQVAEITIGDRTTRTVVGGGSFTPKRRRVHIPKDSAAKKFSQFAMPGTQMESDDECPEQESESGEREEQDGQEAVEDSDEEMLFVPQNDKREINRARHETPQLTSQTLESSHTSPIDEFLRSTKEFDDHLQRAGEGEADSDPEFVDEDERRIQEDAKVARMIQDAENEAARPVQDSIKRAAQALKVSKHTTLNLTQAFDISTASIAEQVALLSQSLPTSQEALQPDKPVADDIEQVDAEARLSLTVLKSDFAQMNVIGQFNLGFVLAVRPSSEAVKSSDLFIIDQHAADEKFNFERFTASSTLEAQPLAQPKQLELTAIEEEIILENKKALTANGFIIETDVSGESDVGFRCKLLALPMSKSVVFDLSDLEELLHLLSDYAGGDIPRPSRVRKVLASRACRASIMVGNSLTGNQMLKVVRNLGEMDKPWNCPHGRPTMRHLANLGAWGFEDEEQPKTDWKAWVKKAKAEDDDASDPEDEE
ncbi:DNA mismatch repair protein MutL [Aureobasidium pullulans]|uniref:DNA mismatch repair protein PMS1 n=1 Tax=Aureobasidium pullulans TaxID=5580 RepID=A0A4S9Y835_AURPU|nr:DNA mismatch repair protein MutL [Aureobasidium pullulans]